MQFARDTYSYIWPRDGALVADSLDLAGNFLRRYLISIQLIVGCLPIP